MKNFVIVVLILIHLVLTNLALGSEIMSKVTKEIERVHFMRESLVSGVQGQVSPEVFKAVCMPVGQELQKLSKTLGVKVKQTSMKYRNLNHKPNKLEESILKTLDQDKGIVSLWKTSESGLYYFRRINIQKSCLNCHGSKESRPVFIKQKYPMDKAYDFKVDELRGMYSVFIPNNGKSEK